MNIYPGNLRNTLKQINIFPRMEEKMKVTEISKNVIAEDRGSSPPQKSLSWIRNNISSYGGIRVHSLVDVGYPEVTGYIIPTLLTYGEFELAQEFVSWLISIQREDGSFTDPEHGESLVFDTGQVLRGLLAMGDFSPLIQGAIARAAGFIFSQMVDNGLKGFVKQYSNNIPESVNLYVLPPLIMSAQALGRMDYASAAERCFEYYIAQSCTLNKDTLTHFLGYEIEALIELGYEKVTLPVLEYLKSLQNSDGSVRGIAQKPWVCVPGLAQLAICWYKIGDWEPADKAMTWLDSHQNATGGFWGSIGRKSDYFQDKEIPWSVKFYLDANYLRIKSFFNRNVDAFPNSIDLDDGRVEALIERITFNDNILEVGCGKGRFLSALKERFPMNSFAGVDISNALLECVPDGIDVHEGALESIPLEDDLFDVVFSVEAIEHSSNPKRAVAEMIRVAKPGGWILIIDKHRSQWGRLNTPPWESWPEIDELRIALSRYCDNTYARKVGYNHKSEKDGLMMIWGGQKRSRLTASDWGNVILPNSNEEMIRRIKSNRISLWGREMVLNTEYGETVLEIGSGTGEISLFLARSGRKVSVLDYCPESLEFIQEVAKDIGVSIQTQKSDATVRLPYPDGCFDCVWSSGLLEHFNKFERVRLLKEWGRVAKTTLISLVPNASSIAYRSGKSTQERQSVWQYGIENPIVSLQNEYQEAGLELVSEYSISPYHSLKFLPVNDPLRTAVTAFFDTLSIDELKSINQGYLLFTVGRKVI